MDIEEAKNILKETQDSYLKDELDIAIETVLAELDKQEKIINAMVNDIARDWDINEILCRHKINNSCSGIDIDRCSKCIKEYYEKKASEE